ncbi:ABC transporter ATP-binding protein [Bacillus sp. SL00103]
MRYSKEGQTLLLWTKKKLSFIFIALTKPTYLFLDEISNGLDYGTMMELKAMIKKWSEDMTIIATGHQFEFLFIYCG